MGNHTGEGDEEDNTRTSVNVPPNVHGQPVDFSISSGAVDPTDATRDADTPVRDEIGERTTSFDPTEGSGSTNWYRINNHDRGMYNPNAQWVPQRREYHRRKDREHIAHHLGMDEYLPRVEEIMSAITMNDLSPHPHEAIVLTAFTLVANDDGFDIREGAVGTNEHFVDAFVELREVNSVSREDIRHLRKKMPTLTQARTTNAE